MVACPAAIIESAALPRARTSPAAIRATARTAAKATAIGVVVLCAFVSHEALLAQRAARSAEQALAGAQRDVRDGRLDDARRSLAAARAGFERSSATLRIMSAVTGPIPGAGRALEPDLRSAEALAAVGVRLCDAGLRLVAVTRAGLPAPPTADAGGARRSRSARSEAVSPSLAPLDGLRRTLRAVRRERTAVDSAGATVDALKPTVLGATVLRARTRLARLRAQLRSGERALSAAIVFLGGDGPRRYLVLSQNPDEPRPTGGFIGTYGLLTAREGRVSLARYASIESWYLARTRAVVTASRAPRALRLPQPPVAQTLANVNATADWPHAARLARRLWRRGGETPVDGVVSFTPDLVARVLAVLGPVRVPGYGPAVTSHDVVARLDRYTHRPARARGADRKRFVALLAERLTRRMSATTRRWPALARALAVGLGAREGMAWSSDRPVQRALAERGWAGTLPAVRGDFFYDAEFSYPAKNGRELRRTYGHDVELRADGSARVATTVQIRNANRLGYPLSTYATLYGPTGARLDRTYSDVPTGTEPAIGGHPGAGWLLAARAWGTTGMRVAWNVPRLLARRPDGTLEYRLTWLRVAAHAGDILRLTVAPPPGWHWKGSAPPRTIPLRRDVRRTWVLGRE